MWGDFEGDAINLNYPKKLWSTSKKWENSDKNSVKDCEADVVKNITAPPSAVALFADFITSLSVSSGNLRYSIRIQIFPQFFLCFLRWTLAEWKFHYNFSSFFLFNCCANVIVCKVDKNSISFFLLEHFSKEKLVLSALCLYKSIT